MIASFAHPVLTLLIVSGLTTAPSPALGQCDGSVADRSSGCNTGDEAKGLRLARRGGPRLPPELGGRVEPEPPDIRPDTDGRPGAWECVQLHEAGGRRVCRRVAEGVEPLPGVKGAYMVFDPKTPNRRVFVKYKGKVYMIVSQDQVPLAVLAKAVVQP